MNRVRLNDGEILIWDSTNLLLLVNVVIGLVMLVRWLQGRACCGAVPRNDCMLNLTFGNVSALKLLASEITVTQCAVTVVQTLRSLSGGNGSAGHLSAGIIALSICRLTCMCAGFAGFSSRGWNGWYRFLGCTT
jgi:hypothetical protein